MRLDSRKIFPVPLSTTEKLILTRLAVASGMTRCAVLRQLLIREHQTPSDQKRLARSDR